MSALALAPPLLLPGPRLHVPDWRPRLARIAGMLLAKNSPTPVTYATWNSGDKHANITLSLGDLRATNSSGDSSTYAGVRSNIGKSSGKWYWEYTLVTAVDTMVGANKSSDGLSWPTPGFGTTRMYYNGTGNKYDGASAYGSTYTVGDIIGVKLDKDGDTLELLKNNTSQGNIDGALSAGTYYAHTVINGGSSSAVNANFGASAFTYSVPSGYNAGLYT